MKWPESLVLIRHDESAYNALKKAKKEDPLYQEFLKVYDQHCDLVRTKELAEQVWAKFTLDCSDGDTPLADGAGWQARAMAEKLRERIALPDYIFVSPYVRTLDTLAWMREGWPDLKSIEEKEDERIREQEHGLALLYNDWRIFQTLHPLQRMLRAREGSYWYRYPQGESVPDVRDRVRSWATTLIREFSGKKVLAVTHHLCILAIRAHLERLSAEEFIRLDQKEAPINCGVTIYRGDPSQGQDGKLILESYNEKLY